MEELCSLSGTKFTFTYDPQQFLILHVSSMIFPEWRQQHNWLRIPTNTARYASQYARASELLKKVERAIFKNQLLVLKYA